MAHLAAIRDFTDQVLLAHIGKQLKAGDPSTVGSGFPAHLPSLFLYHGQHLPLLHRDGPFTGTWKERDRLANTCVLVYAYKIIHTQFSQSKGRATGRKYLSENKTFDSWFCVLKWYRSLFLVPEMFSFLMKVKQTQLDFFSTQLWYCQRLRVLFVWSKSKLVKFWQIWAPARDKKVHYCACIC